MSDLRTLRIELERTTALAEQARAALTAAIQRAGLNDGVQRSELEWFEQIVREILRLQAGAGVAELSALARDEGVLVVSVSYRAGSGWTAALESEDAQGVARVLAAPGVTAAAAIAALVAAKGA